MVLRVLENKNDENPVLKARIVAEARELFLRRGFSAVTTGEISSELGIGKATLYKHFPSKAEILRAVVDSIKAEVLGGFERSLEDGSVDFLEKFIRLATFMGEWLSRLGSVLIQDLRRNAPGVWREIDEFRKDRILVNFGALIEGGIAAGVFRPDVDRELAVRMFLSLVQGFLNPDFLRDPRTSARDVFETLFKLFFEGMLTDGARAGLAGRGPERLFRSKEVLR